MSLPEQAPETKTSEICYPESDHMGESGLQKWVCDLMIGLLQSYFAENEERPMLVGGNQFFYLREGDDKLRLAPDVYVVEDEILTLAQIKSWRVWEHEGKGPALAIEVVSDEYEKDYDPVQLERYERLGVHELLRYDPEFYLHPRAMKFGPRRLLTHWTRNEAGRLIERPLASKRTVKSARYGFWFVHEPHRSLRLGVGPQGRHLWPTAAERAQIEAERAKVEAERAQAEAERAKVEAERAQAEAERAKVEASRADRAEAEMKRLRDELERLRRGSQPPG
jgi:Uma2 family endonuclease